MTVLDPRPLRVVIAEDHVLLREGMVGLLREYGVDVVAQTGDTADLLDKVGTHRPDVAVTDVQVRRGQLPDGMRAALRIRAQHPDVGVLVLSETPDEQDAMELIGADARRVGYLHKDRVGDVGAFIDAIARVARGESAVDRDLVATLLAHGDRADLVERLRPREREVLALMIEGRSNSWIGRALRLSVRSVEQHAAGVFKRLGLEAEPDEDRRVAVLLRELLGPGAVLDDQKAG